MVVCDALPMTGDLGATMMRAATERYLLAELGGRVPLNGPAGLPSAADRPARGRAGLTPYPLALVSASTTDRAMTVTSTRAGRGWTMAGDLAGRPAVRPRAARRGRPAQRRRPLPLLAARGDRRRPRRAPARLPRRDRELAARLQHRHRGAQRQRVPRRRGAHRRSAPVEPARRHGHRSLPARPPPRDDRGVRRLGARTRACRWSASTTCPARGRSRRPTCRGACVLLFGQEGPGLSDAGPRRLRRSSSRSRSTARPGRSTPGWPAASPCTPGSAPTPGRRRTDRRIAPGSADPLDGARRYRRDGRDVGVAVSCPRCGGAGPAAGPDAQRVAVRRLRPGAAAARRRAHRRRDRGERGASGSAAPTGRPADAALVPVAAAAGLDGHRRRLGRRRPDRRTGHRGGLQPARRRSAAGRPTWSSSPRSRASGWAPGSPGMPGLGPRAPDRRGADRARPGASRACRTPRSGSAAIRLHCGGQVPGRIEARTSARPGECGSMR